MQALGVAVLLQMPQAVLAQSSSDSSSSSTIVYVVIGVAVLLVLLAGAFFWRRRQKKIKNKNAAELEDGGRRVNNNNNSRQLIVNAIGANNNNNNRSGNDYDIHNSPAVASKANKPRVPRPQQGSRLPPQNPAGTRPPTGQAEPPTTFGSGPSAGMSSYTPSQGSSTGSSAREANDSTRSKEVLALVLADLQNDPAVGRRKIAYSALYFTRVLSKGAFGEVWLAQLENRQVAVKRILNEKRNDEKEIVCFGAEIKLMAAFLHPKIVEFVGVSWSSSNDICAVTEYMAKGDLYQLLQKRRNGQINWADHKIYLAEDVADALVYLHSLTPKVIHRDLKSKNILLDDEFRAKLSDFGISRERSLEETMTAGVGTIYWTAPEVLMGRKYTEKADIYSFGIVLSELDTHEVPYHDVRDDGRKLQAMKIVKKVISENLRPTFTAAMPPIVMDLARRCLDSEPNVRPDAVELLRIIQNIQHQLY